MNRSHNSHLVSVALILVVASALVSAQAPV